MTPPVYLIVSPGLRAKVPRLWERWRGELAALLPGATLACWADLPAAFRDVPSAERPGRLARALAAAVIVPDKLKGNGHPRRWLGPVAVAEAFTAAGKPVLVYAAGELVPWENCEVRRKGTGPRWTPV